MKYFLFISEARNLASVDIVKKAKYYVVTFITEISSFEKKEKKTDFITLYF